MLPPPDPPPAAAPAPAWTGLLDPRREYLGDVLRLVGSGVWLPWVYLKRPEAVGLWAPLTLIPVVAVASMLLRRWRVAVRARQAVVGLLDVVLLLVCVWGLGSTTTPVLSFSIISVMIFTMTASPVLAGALGLTLVGLYGAVLLLEIRGILPVAPLAHPGLGPHETSGGRQLAFVTVLLGVGSTFGFLLYVRRRLEQGLQRERELRLAQEAAQLRARELQSQLERVQRLESMGRLVGGVAHDFNNLLSVIQGVLTTLREEAPPGNPDVEEALQDGADASQQAANLTRQLLAFGRRQPVHPVVVDTPVALQGALRMLRRLLGEQVVVEADLAPDLAPVKMDPTQLEQMLVNLAVNARDAMPAGGRLVIQGRNVVLDAASCELRPGLTPGEHVEVRVQDTGCGMDEATRQRAMEPFFTTKPAGRGTGLGLSIVFGIMQQQRGWVELASTPGAGTTVTLLLPRSTEAPAAKENAPAPAPRGHERVLVVEDEASIRRIVRRTLERLGYSVVEAASGQEALDLVQRDGRAVDVLVTDLVMPGLSGTDLAERLRLSQPGLPVLLISGYSRESKAVDALLEQGALFLPKPFSPEQLAEAVRQLADARQPAVTA